MNVRSFLLAAMVFLIIKANVGYAAEPVKYQGIDSLREKVTEEIKNHIVSIQPQLVYGEDLFIEVGHIDSRLQLSQCDNSLTMKINKPPHNASHITVKTSCTTGARWTIYIPATIEIFSDIVIAAQDLPKGTVLTENELTVMRMNTAKLGIGVFNQPSEVTGLQITRPLRSGSPIKQSNVKKPNIVAKGDSVVLESKSTLIKVEVTGIALDAGYLGQQIRVRNNQSQRVVDGLVIGRGKVRTAIY